jgi:ketosteroid isomerase-like protein
VTPEEALRRTYEAFTAGVAGAEDELWHPDIEYHEAPAFPGAGSYRGREAVAAKFAEYVEVLGIERAELRRVVTRGDEAAWVVRFSGRSAEGVPNSHSWGYVGRFEDGLLLELRAYYYPEHAFDDFESQG